MMKKTKKYIKVFLHKVRVIIRKIKKNKIYKYKYRYLIIMILFTFTFFLGINSLMLSFSKYESKVSLNLDVSAALYLLKDGKYSFTLNMDGIVPRDEPYIYNFTISNFEDRKVNNVDMDYKINLVTTTNLPLTYELYKNDQSIDINKNILNTVQYKKDEDLAWYGHYESKLQNTLMHDTKTTDNYYLVVRFPGVYGNYVGYAGQIESVEIIVDSKQII